MCQFKLVLLGASRASSVLGVTPQRSAHQRARAGESSVGKSSLVLRFAKGQFHEYQESTIGGAFVVGCAG
jgi:hypothetical protein